MSAIITPVAAEFRTDDGLRLVADRWGDGDHTVLLFHGGGQTRHAWGGAAERLAAAGWTAFTIDQRGHGESDWSAEGRYAIDHFAEDVRGICRGFPVPPAVVGASLGGISALIAQGECDEAILSALVLVDITPRVERAGVERIINFMAAKAESGFATLEECADYVASYLPHRKRPKDLSGLMKNLRQRDDGRYYWHWDPRFVTDADKRMEDRDPERMIAAARRLKCPTLLVRGGSSDLVSETVAREFLDLVPQAEFADVAGAGHMVAGDKNDAFTEAVLPFLEKHH
ncbi:MAG: alpha/beta hydrolase [Alphaproteobacteria bacterium]|nr:alpha/beta hydrolase [Alphaproteobacteria bacterium]MCB9928296.1 alpha/beta hydrolase [Alphaproteobacteria bacterium]